MNMVKINLHNEKATKASGVARRHYTVGQLIAELQCYNKDAIVVAQDMLTNEFQALDFRGVETVREEAFVDVTTGEVYEMDENELEALNELG